MIQPERVRHLLKAPIGKGTFVLYWMQQSQRAHFNHALEYAIIRANEISLPVVVCFCVDDSFPSANLRHYSFMLEGLAQTGKKLQSNNILFVLLSGSPEKNIPHLARNAAMIITDAGYTKIQRLWRSRIAEELDREFVQVESDITVPVETASQKEEYGAYTIRPKINRLLDRFLVPLSENTPIFSSLSLEIPSLEWENPEKILSSMNMDKTVKRAPGPKAGTDEALSRLDRFISKNLAHYEKNGSNPTLDATSGLSPYFHFGQLSPLYAGLKVSESGYPGAKAFLEQLIIRRELAVNFVYYNHDYNNLRCLPDWCKKTLSEHVNDKRSYIYNIESLERAVTHDPYWNAAQKEMICTGRMHNYMRMYWGKKILEWSGSPEEAYEKAIYLNDKYQLDGRDPNGYAGVAWCFGKHDRPWTNRPVFGMIRYMNDGGLKRKFNPNLYVEKVNSLCGSYGDSAPFKGF